MHTDAIITDDKKAADYFLKNIKSSIGIHNSSLNLQMVESLALELRLVYQQIICHQGGLLAWDNL